MAAVLRATQDDETRRLEAMRGVMAGSRELAGRGHLTAGIFERAGVGDWGDAPPYARSIAFACRLCRSPESLETFRSLVSHVEARAGRLLHDRCPDGQRNYLLVLQQLAERHSLWRRPPVEWRPRTGPAAKQFAALLSYLLDPESRESFERDVFSQDAAATLQLWFGHLNRGANNRPDALRPVYLTKKMGFHFLQAPAHYDLIRALRWGQVYGLGGTTRLAKAVDFTRLAWQIWDSREEEWWAGVLHWFANHPDLDSLQVTPIVDLVYAQRYGDPDAGLAPNPGYSMKGRTTQSMLRLVDEWHEELTSRKNVGYAEFRPCGVKPGRWEIEEDDVLQVWTVEEVLDSATLQEEGRKMRHCVASYLEAIERGKCSIFSMKTARGHMVKRAVTIQLNHASRRIVQCRGHCNRAPKKEEKRVLKLWAAENGLYGA